MSSYIAEMSPKKYRGRTTSLVGVFYGVFLVFQYGANCGYSQFCTGWRVSFAVQVVGGVVFGLITLFIPRTPR